MTDANSTFDRPSPNLDLARAILEWLASQGVAEVCLCPGGRNAPFVAVLDGAEGMTVHGGFDERAASFFALGRARATGRPVAVCTTSGTAAAELMPAAIEAHYSGDSLVLITADRPPWFRGTGAPQAIEQVGMFGPYARTIEVSRVDDLPIAMLAGRPLHLDVPLDEPLLDKRPRDAIAPLRVEPAAPARPALPLDDELRRPLRSALEGWRCPLVVLGAIEPADRDAVRELLLRWRPLVFAEAPSGLREDPSLAPLMLASGDGILRADGPLFGPGPGQAAIDGVLRLGRVPTTRLWRDLAGKLAWVRCLSVGSLPWSGLPDGPLVQAALRDAFAGIEPGSVDEPVLEALRSIDRQRKQALDALLLDHPRSEAALVHRLSTHLGPQDLAYVGNSLPIRLWDLVAARQMPRAIGCNRGANGIDGQLSTFLGWAGDRPEGATAWGLFGDLTALYDLSAPWVLGGEGGGVRLVVSNNGGGRIFGRLFESTLFQNRHEVGFAHWAAMWGLEHARLESLPLAREGELPPATVLELVPDETQSQAFWSRYDALHAAP